VWKVKTSEKNINNQNCIYDEIKSRYFQRMPTTILLWIFCVPAYYLKILRLKPSELWFRLLFYVGVIPRLTYRGKNIGWGYSRTGCWAGYLGLRDELIGDGWELHSEELHHFYSLPNVFGGSNLKEWGGQVMWYVRGGEVYRGFWWESWRRETTWNT
jgi:hypothetical protein